MTPDPLQQIRETIGALYDAICNPTVEHVRHVNEANAALDGLRLLPDGHEAVEHVEPREGTHRVYDNHGRYVGCIGTETWARLVAVAEAARKAVILEYDPARTPEQNALIAERAKNLRDALAALEQDAP